MICLVINLRASWNGIQNHGPSRQDAVHLVHVLPHSKNKLPPVLKCFVHFQNDRAIKKFSETVNFFSRHPIQWLGVIIWNSTQNLVFVLSFHRLHKMNALWEIIYLSEYFISGTTGRIWMKFVIAVYITSCWTNLFFIPIDPIQPLLYTKIKSDIRDYLKIYVYMFTCLHISLELFSTYIGLMHVPSILIFLIYLCRQQVKAVSFQASFYITFSPYILQSSRLVPLILILSNAMV